MLGLIVQVRYSQLGREREREREREKEPERERGRAMDALRGT